MRIGLFILLLAFALLIRNAAARFASGLAGSLALTATAVLCALAQVFGFQSLNTSHFGNPQDLIVWLIIAYQMG